MDTVTITVNADNDASDGERRSRTRVDCGEWRWSRWTAVARTDPENQTLTYTWVQTGGPDGDAE